MIIENNDILIKIFGARLGDQNLSPPTLRVVDLVVKICHVLAVSHIRGRENLRGTVGQGEIIIHNQRGMSSFIRCVLTLYLIRAYDTLKWDFLDKKNQQLCVVGSGTGTCAFGWTLYKFVESCLKYSCTLKKIKLNCW